MTEMTPQAIYDKVAEAIAYEWVWLSPPEENLTDYIRGRKVSLEFIQVNIADELKQLDQNFDEDDFMQKSSPRSKRYA